MLDTPTFAKFNQLYKNALFMRFINQQKKFLHSFRLIKKNFFSVGG